MRKLLYGSSCRKIKQFDVNQLRQFALHKGWQLYLQPKGPESLRRIDEEQGAMRLHYALNELDKFCFFAIGFYAGQCDSK